MQEALHLLPLDVLKALANFGKQNVSPRPALGIRNHQQLICYKSLELSCTELLSSYWNPQVDDVTSWTPSGCSNF